MTSKNSFFKLIRENLKRRTWVFALSILIFFFVFPIATLANIHSFLINDLSTDFLRTYYVGRFISTFKESYAAANWSMVFCFASLSLFTGVSAFSYLDNTKASDFYHSLPVSKKRLFVSVNVTSLLIVALPYLVMSLISTLIVIINVGKFELLSYMLLEFAKGLCYFLLLYMTVVLAMILTGTKAGGILGSIFLFAVGPVICLVINGYESVFYNNFYVNNAELYSLVQKVSPFAFCLDLGEKYTLFSTGIKAVIALGLSAVLWFISNYLYKIRKMERAGEFIVFRPIKPFVKIIVLIPIALMFSMFFGEFVNTDAWRIAGIVLAVLIFHAIIEVIYNSDFKKALSHKVELLISLGLSLFVFAFFRFDLSGHDKYIPEPDKIQSASIFCSNLDSVYSDSEHIEVVYHPGGGMNVEHDQRDVNDVLTNMHIKDSATLLELAKIGIEDSEYFKNNSTDYREGFYPANIIICWHLNNGKDVYRSYSINLARAYNELDAVYNNPDYKLGTYPILKFDPERIADLVGVNVQDYLGFRPVSMNGNEDPLNSSPSDETIDEVARLYRAYVKELLALTNNDRRSSKIIGCIQFKNKEFAEALLETTERGNISYGRDAFNYINFYPIYDCFTETLSILKSKGIILNESLNADNVSMVTLRDDRYYGDIDGEKGSSFIPKDDLVLTDKDEINALIDSAVVSNLNCDNPCLPSFYGISINLKVNAAGYKDNTKFPITFDLYDTKESTSLDRNYTELYLNLDAANIPDFIVKYFDITDDDKLRFSNNAYTAWIPMPIESMALE